MSQFLRFDPSLDRPGDDEDKIAQDLADAMLSISRKTFADGHHAIRSVHAKSHGLLTGQLEVLGAIPSPYAQGLFAAPGQYPAAMRLSTIPGDILSDKVSTPRGAALKIAGVQGYRPEGSETTGTQDFVLVNGPAFGTKDPKSFLHNIQLLAKTTDKAEGAKEALAGGLRATEKVIEAFGGTSATLRSLGGEPPNHILGETFFSQLPLRYGDYVAKIQLVPSSQNLKAHTGRKVDLSEDDNILRQMVVAHFAREDGVRDLRVQLCTENLENTPIDDPTKVWDEALTPFVTVARLHMPAQCAWSDARSAAIDDGMAFDPWQCLEAHRPLGQFMRLRRYVYAASRKFRSERNPTRVTEPSSFDHVRD